MSAEGQSSVVSLVQQVMRLNVKQKRFTLLATHTNPKLPLRNLNYFVAAKSGHHYQRRTFCEVEFTAGEYCVVLVASLCASRLVVAAAEPPFRNQKSLLRRPRPNQRRPALPGNHHHHP